ncbi:CASP-like protein 3A1 [Henckelia pumila]|uniref:CASP-like protein 3A1 n=1 Tax=Henckelia pumila TaxID=405737 RepID=UPI003C6DDDB8
MARNGSREGVDVVIETRADGGRRNGGQEVAGYGKADVMHALIRLLCASTSLTGVLVMMTAKLQASTISRGYDSQWFLVGMCGVVAIHSFCQMCIKLGGMLSKPPIIPSRKNGWTLFAADLVNALALTSAGLNASRLLPDFCQPLHSFCDLVYVALVLTFISCSFLYVSVVFDVVWLASEH